jgi:hypothetical protein
MVFYFVIDSIKPYVCAFTSLFMMDTLIDSDSDSDAEEYAEEYCENL